MARRVFAVRVSPAAGPPVALRAWRAVLAAPGAQGRAALRPGRQSLEQAGGCRRAWVGR